MVTYDCLFHTRKNKSWQGSWLFSIFNTLSWDHRNTTHPLATLFIHISSPKPKIWQFTLLRDFRLMTGATTASNIAYIIYIWQYLNQWLLWYTTMLYKSGCICISLCWLPLLILGRIIITRNAISWKYFPERNKKVWWNIGLKGGRGDGMSSCRCVW